MSPLPPSSSSPPRRPFSPSPYRGPRPSGMGGTGGGSGPRRYGTPPPPPDAHRINDRILAREVRVIGPAGENFGVLEIRAAISKAEEFGVDLVEVAPDGKPPVCRIMDYGKFKYKEQKKEAESRKNRSEQALKELRVRYRTDVGDLEVKLRQARGFLEDGDKVKFSMRFKGREIQYVNLGVDKFKEIIARLADISVVDEQSPPHGRQIHIVLAPKKSAAEKTTAAAEQKK